MTYMNRLVLWLLAFVALYLATYFTLPLSRMIAGNLSVVHPVSYTAWIYAFIPYLIGFKNWGSRSIVMHALGATMFIFAAVIADKEGACEVGRVIFWGTALMSLITVSRRTEELRRRSDARIDKWFGPKLVAFGLIFLFPLGLEFLPMFK